MHCVDGRQTVERNVRGEVDIDDLLLAILTVLAGRGVILRTHVSDAQSYTI